MTKQAGMAQAGIRRVFQRLKIGRSGATAAEFAVMIPVFLLFFFGIIQVGILFFNYTSLQNAVGEGAREATLFPRRTNAQISAKIINTGFGLDPAKFAAPVIVRGTDNAQDFVDLTVRYTVDFNFGIATFPGLTLTQRRRAYLP